MAGIALKEENLCPKCNSADGIGFTRPVSWGKVRRMIRAFQWDLARQAERLDWLLAQLPHYANWGYQELYLHLEDAVEFPSLPAIARRGAYSYKQFARLVAAAQRVGIGVVPIVNLLGHTQYIIKAPEFRDLNELRNAEGGPLPQGQICPLHPRTLEVAAQLLGDMAPFCTAGKIHVGLDESFHLGKHPLSRAEIALVGRAAHFARYVLKLHRLTEQLGLQLGMWADMLYFLPEAIPLLPKKIAAYDWYYYPFKSLPRVELYNFAPRDLASPLQKQGIDYWGCPMNGAFRHEILPVFGERLDNIKSWWRRCGDVNATGFLVTSWEPSRLALPNTTLVDAAAARLWSGQRTLTNAAMLTAGIDRLSPTKQAARFARQALRADREAFVGGQRWEINRRWDVYFDSPRPPWLKGEIKLAAAKADSTLPAALHHSLEFRRYIARREIFVFQASAAIVRWRRSAKPVESGASPDPAIFKSAATFLAGARKFQSDLSCARTHAEMMWRETRRRDDSHPNAKILRGDAARLETWEKWLQAVRADPQKIWSASPMGGKLHLRCTVYLRRPNQQKILVYSQVGRAWREVYSQSLIEFRAAAAVTRSTLHQELSIPLDDYPERLRLALRGLGEVAVGNVYLTDGRIKANLLAPRARRILGQPAPTHGWPALDWSVDASKVEWALPSSFRQAGLVRTRH